MGDAPPISDLVDRIYDAVGEDARWQDLLAGFRTRWNCTAADIVLVSPNAGVANMQFSAGFAPEMRDTYNAYYGGTDPWVAAVARDPIPPGIVRPSEALVPLPEFEKTEFYNDWGREAEILHGTGTWLSFDKGTGIVFSLLRAGSMGAYSAREIAEIQSLVPHLRRATLLHMRLERALVDGAASRAALDHLHCGVFVLDEAGRVIASNRLAGAIVDENDGLALGRGKHLHAGHRTTDAHLRALIGKAAHEAVEPGRTPGGELAVPRPSGQRPYALVVSHLPVGRGARAPGGAAVLVLVSDPERTREAKPAYLSRMLGLTPREAEVAVALTQGKTIAEFAEENCVTRETARWYLKQLLTKTETRRQAELVLLLGKYLAVAG